MTDVTTRHEITIRLPYLRLIASGVKTLEVRVGYPRMRKIQAGHQLTFISGGQRVLTRVKRVTEYPSFDAMFDHEDPRSIGGSWARAVTACSPSSGKSTRLRRSASGCSPSRSSRPPDRLGDQLVDSSSPSVTG